MLTSYILRPEPAHSTRATGPLLAIDTSSARAGIALRKEGGLHESTWPCERAQTTQVPVRIDQLLRNAGVETSDLAAVAVATGPGTFTGLRVGVSLAKGLAMAHGLPILGVPTLMATALPWVMAGRSVMAVLPAGRGRLVWQRYGPDRDDGGPVNGTPGELLAELGTVDIDAVVGELSPPLRAALDAAEAPVVVEEGMMSRIGAVAWIGGRRLASGEADDLATLEPLYVHGVSSAKRPVRDG